MKIKTSLFLAFGVIKLLIHSIGNQNYGYHRDELLHLACGEHLAWGYVEFPPFIAWLASLSHVLFDASLGGTRLFATLAGLGILWVVLSIAEELGAEWRGMLIAGICVLAFLPFYRNHTLFQPVAFDQFFWTLAFYFLLRYLRLGNWTSLVGLAVAVGLGLLNKYTRSEVV